MSDSPVIIIGTGRSGTNMLRDLLVSHDAFVTWPCDEINYIWRHRNRDFETDQFTREMASASARQYIQKQFSALAAGHAGATVVEKTCANSLRCGFVHEIFPNAKFVHLVRDGRDVAASAALRWNAELDLGYILKKARFVPRTDLPWYASKYVSARLYRLFSGKKRLSTWGPRFEGMQDAFGNHELPVGCAIQWQECVSAATQQLAEIDDRQVFTVRYEEFTREPVGHLGSVFDFLGVPVANDQLVKMSSGVSDRSVGKWKQQLTDSQISAIESVAEPWLRRLGYDR